MGLIKIKDSSYCVKLFDKSSNSQKEVCFDSKRTCGKELMINAMYSKKGKSSNKAVNGVKDLFPSVFLLVDTFKKSNFKDLALILQRMEAKCVLDYCAKNIANEFPYIPLVSRHDSLSTPEEYGEQLLKQFQLSVNNYFETPVQLKEIEVW